MKVATGSSSTDWASIRDTIDLAAVVTQHLGPPKQHRGSRLSWICPFPGHDDHRPSLHVDTVKQRWRCYPCDLSGDTASFVMRYANMTFPDAVAYLTGKATVAPAKTIRAKPNKPETKWEPPPREWQTAAIAFIAEAEAWLWCPDGAEPLAYLCARGLNHETIRRARLGFVAEGRPGIAAGVTIPWFDGSAPTLINVRRPAGADPKYMAVKGSRRGGLYPGSSAVLPGKPLVIVEGEFEALLLGQELGELAGVVTLGGAWSDPGPEILAALLCTSPWFVAIDNDPTGDKAAGKWTASSSRARRVRPPGAFKDWTEMHQAGAGLRRWWSAILAGDERPPLFTWEELSKLRWGDAVGDPTPGIIVD